MTTAISSAQLKLLDPTSTICPRCKQSVDTVYSAADIVAWPKFFGDDGLQMPWFVIERVPKYLHAYLVKPRLMVFAPCMHFVDGYVALSCIRYAAKLATKNPDKKSVGPVHSSIVAAQTTVASYAATIAAINQARESLANSPGIDEIIVKRLVVLANHIQIVAGAYANTTLPALFVTEDTLKWAQSNGLNVPAHWRNTQPTPHVFSKYPKDTFMTQTTAMINTWDELQKELPPEFEDNDPNAVVFKGTSVELQPNSINAVSHSPGAANTFTSSHAALKQFKAKLSEKKHKWPVAVHGLDFSTVWSDPAPVVHGPVEANNGDNKPSSHTDQEYLVDDAMTWYTADPETEDKPIPPVQFTASVGITDGSNYPTHGLVPNMQTSNNLSDDVTHGGPKVYLKSDCSHTLTFNGMYIAKSESSAGSSKSDMSKIGSGTVHKPLGMLRNAGETWALHISVDTVLRFSRYADAREFGERFTDLVDSKVPHSLHPAAVPVSNSFLQKFSSDHGRLQIDKLCKRYGYAVVGRLVQKIMTIAAIDTEELPALGALYSVSESLKFVITSKAEGSVAPVGGKRVRRVRKIDLE